MTDTNYEPDETTFSHALKARVKNILHLDTSSKPKQVPDKTRMDQEIDAAEQGRQGKDAGELYKPFKNINDE